jgi:hypothetical protein
MIMQLLLHALHASLEWKNLKTSVIEDSFGVIDHWFPGQGIYWAGEQPGLVIGALGYEFAGTRHHWDEEQPWQ